MNRQLRTSVFLMAFTFVFAGCVSAEKNAREIKELGPPLLRLTSAVHGVAERPVLYGLPPGGSGEDCLRLGTKDDPSLRDPFKGLLVKVKCENKNAIVLICDSEGKTALFEDAGCTTKIDYRQEDSNSVRACDFFIQPESVCPK